jgi:hypothetical protein
MITNTLQKKLEKVTSAAGRAAHTSGTLPLSARDPAQGSAGLHACCTGCLCTPGRYPLPPRPAPPAPCSRTAPPRPARLIGRWLG